MSALLSICKEGSMEIGRVAKPSPMRRPSDVERSDGSFTAKDSVRRRIGDSRREQRTTNDGANRQVFPDTGV